MNSHYLTITEEMMEKSEISILRTIQRNREKIRLLRRLAVLNGRYVTKRLDPKLKELFPEYLHAYIGKSSSYSHRLSVHISANAAEGWYETLHLDIALDTERRVSMTLINEQIEAAQKEIEADTAALQSFRECAAQWNNLIAYAAAIHETLSRCLRNCGDYKAERIRSM